MGWLVPEEMMRLKFTNAQNWSWTGLRGDQALPGSTQGYTRYTQADTHESCHRPQNSQSLSKLTASHKADVLPASHKADVLHVGCKLQTSGNERERWQVC